MTNNAAQFVGSIPTHYDAGLGPHIFTGFAADLAQRVAGLNPATVLELAAGTGIVTRELRNLLADVCELVATDLNEPMLEVAQTKFTPEERVRFEQVDATRLSYADESFDALACQFGVMFFPDKAESFAEAHRVLRDGGSYVFNVWDSWAENPFAELAHEVVTAFFPDDPPGFYKVPFHYHDADEIQETVSGAGFADVTVEPVALTSKIPSSRDFATGLVFGNPLYDEVLARGGDPDAVRAAIATAIEDQLGQEMPLQALVVHARKG